MDSPAGRRYRLAIFDFDGTLADSGDWFLSILEPLARRFGFRSVGTDEVEMLRGRTTREVIKYLGIPRWKLPMIARHLRALVGEQSDRIALFDGIGALLEALASGGMRLALVSSNAEANVRAILGPAHSARIDWFECGAPLSGKARRYRRVLRKSGSAPRDAISIGDETRDIVAARKAGIHAGAVAWGYASRDALTRFAPDALFETPGDIARLLLGDVARDESGQRLRSMRTIPDDFDPATVEAIDARLDAIVRDDHVAMPLAIESGSRAWGFASPDSDYDCRFLFVRRRRDYLTLWPRRDVIETPLDGLLDVNGWDLGKALRLIVKGNAVAVEWLRSPIAYRGDDEFRAELDRFAEEHAPLPLVRNHYYHLGRRQWNATAGQDGMAVKKLFYNLRPAAALRWMRTHPGAMPPMRFQTLMAESAPPAHVADLVADLIARKAETRELGRAPVPEAIAAFIEAEYALAADTAERTPPAPAALDAADALFRNLLDRFAPD